MPGMANVGFFLAFTMVAVCVFAISSIQRSRESKLLEPGRDAQPPSEPTQKPKDFDKHFDDLVSERGGKWISCSIVGVSHQNVDGSSRQEFVAKLKPWQELQLRREPDNPFGSTATAVLDGEGNQLGYVPAWLSRELAPEMDKGKETVCLVRDAGNTEGRWGAAIGVCWYPRPCTPDLKDEESFVRSLDGAVGAEIEEWFWAKLTGLKGRTFFGEKRQDTIIWSLSPGDRLRVEEDLGGKGLIVLGSKDGGEAGTLSKRQAEGVKNRIASGSRYEGIVFDTQEMEDGTGWEPHVAIVRLKG